MREEYHGFKLGGEFQVLFALEPGDDQKWRVKRSFSQQEKPKRFTVIQGEARM